MSQVYDLTYSNAYFGGIGMKRYLKISSFILQGIYSAFCVLDIVLCLTYQHYFDTSMGRKCAYWALDLTSILFFVPIIPISLVINILAMPLRQLEPIGRKRWLIWTIISSVVYMIFYIITICVFVATTGGV